MSLSELFSLGPSPREAAYRKVVAAADRCEKYLRIADTAEEYEKRVRFMQGAQRESRRAFAVARSLASNA